MYLKSSDRYVVSHIISHVASLHFYVCVCVLSVSVCHGARRSPGGMTFVLCTAGTSIFARSVNSSKMLICHHAVKIRSPGIKSCFSPFSLPPFRNYLFLLPLRHYFLVDSFPTKGPYQATYPSDKPIHHRNILKMTSPSASIRSFRYDTPVVRGLTSLVPTSRGLKGEFSPLVR